MSESEVIKDNQVLSIERFKSDCDFGLINLRAKQEKREYMELMIKLSTCLFLMMEKDKL